MLRRPLFLLAMMASTWLQACVDFSIDPTAKDFAGKGGLGGTDGTSSDDSGTVASPGECQDGQKNGDETDVDCGGVCGATCTTGQTCTTAADCASQNPCVDGVCCDTACDAACLSCNQPSLEGLCSPFTGEDPSGTCTGGKQCVMDGCRYTNGKYCGADSECASGLCSRGMLEKCAACNMDDQCPGGEHCVGGACTSTDLADGARCTEDSTCLSNRCVDGVCCEAACDGICMACHDSYTGTASGACAPMLAGFDPQDECDGPGKAATCSGKPADANGNSSCGTN